jgi:hypothetical protein
MEISKIMSMCNREDTKELLALMDSIEKCRLGPKATKRLQKFNANIYHHLQIKHIIGFTFEPIRNLYTPPSFAFLQHLPTTRLDDDLYREVNLQLVRKEANMISYRFNRFAQPDQIAYEIDELFIKMMHDAIKKNETCGDISPQVLNEIPDRVGHYQSRSNVNTIIYPRCCRKGSLWDMENSRFKYKLYSSYDSNDIIYVYSGDQRHQRCLVAYNPMLCDMDNMVKFGICENVDIASFFEKHTIK